MEKVDVDKLLNEIKAHTHNWMSKNNYHVPYDYVGLRDILVLAIEHGRCLHTEQVERNEEQAAKHS